MAIIRCYRRFERVAAHARVIRAPWQTPHEFMRETLRRLTVPPIAVDRLTRLFELARFSTHPLGAPERDSARACLEDIRSELERAGGVTWRLSRAGEAASRRRSWSSSPSAPGSR